MVNNTKPKRRSPASEPGKISKRKNSDQQLRKIQTAATQAQAAYQWEKALPLYTQALAVVRQGKQLVSRSNLQAEYDLLDRQAECYRNLGDSAAEAGALEAMLELARQIEDPGRQVRALVRRSATASQQGNLSHSQQLADSALKLTRQAQNFSVEIQRKLEADSLFALGESYFRLGDFPQAKTLMDQSLALYRQLGDQVGEAHALWGLGWVEVRSGQIDPNSDCFTRSLEISRRAGDREGMGNALNGLAQTTNNIALSRSYLEQSLAAFESIGNRERQFVIHNNLSAGNQALGLYDRARLELEPLVETSRRMKTRYIQTYLLENLATTLLGLGEYERARRAALEALELALESGERKMHAGILGDLGHIQLQSGCPDEAVQYYMKAIKEAEALDIPELASGFAWLSAAYLAQGNFEAAYQATVQAITCLRAHGNTTGELPLNEFWWLRYQVLSALTDQPALPNLNQGAEDYGELAWQALDQAREAMLEPIASLSDDGLRRNYFSKVSLNRQIVQEWLREASARGLPLSPLSDHLSQPGDLQTQLQRMLEIGVRLNARRSTQDLPRFIMDEVVELTGADRAALYLMDEAGKRQLAAEVIPPSPQPSPQRGERKHEEQLLDETFLKRAPLLRYIPENAPELEQRSVLCVPLIAQDRLVGLVYTELSGIYGRFTTLDRDLLTVLANQAAVAVENAKWATSLEQRVEHRTAELVLINRVQQALAAQLDTQAIIDLVGEEIRKLFEAQIFHVVHYDRDQDLCYWLYSMVDGERETIAPGPKQGLSGYILETRLPLMINQDLMKRSAALGGVSSGPQTKSYLGVPILIGDEARGVISLQNLVRENAFSESDLRLLTTLANSMGVALENARLFDETRRLLAETEQRAAELAMINSIQQGLAAQLEMQAIFDLVGDKIRQIFDAQVVVIKTFNLTQRTFQVRYAYEKGQRFGAGQELPFNKLYERMVQTRQPVLINRDADQQIIELGLNTEGESPKSFVFVPLVVGDQVKGVISLQNIDQEQAFSESDVRLLTTLANSMSVALENARLFDETRRLLTETEQRASELSLINSVQKGLSAQLGMQAIFDLVGDNVRQIFDAQVVIIKTFNLIQRTFQQRYAYEKGQRFGTDQELPFNKLIERLIQTRQPVLINRDAYQQGNELGMTIIEGSEIPKSMLFVPLVVGEQTNGTISLQNIDQEEAFSEADVRLLQTLANSMSVALENARLFDETKRLLTETEQRAAELSVINSVQAALAAELNIQGIYDTVGDKIREIFHDADLGISIYDPKTGLEHFPYLYENGKRIYLEPIALSEKGFNSYVQRTRETLVINENMNQAIEKYGSHIIPGTSPEKSAVYVPLVVGDQARGLINLMNMEREHAFSEADVRLLQTLANSMSVALENARLFGETQRLLQETKQRASEMTALAEIGNDIASTHELRPVLERLVVRTKELLNVSDIALFMAEPGGETLRAEVALGKYADEIKAASLQIGEGILGDNALQGRAEIIQHPARDPRTIHIPRTPEADDEVEGLMCAPMISRNKVIGMIGVWRQHTDGPFTQPELDFLVSLARQAAIAIESARLFMETERRASQMATIAEVGRELSATLDLQQVVESVAGHAHRLFNARDTILRLVDPDSQNLRTAVALGTYPDQFTTDIIPIGEGITGSIAQTGIAEVINDVASDPRGVHVSGTPDKEEDPETLMVAPLIVQGRTVGTLSVYHSQREGLFTQVDLDFLVGLGRQAAIAIENARLFAEVQRQRQFSESLVQNSPVAIITADDQYIVTSWNQGAERLFGYSAHEAIGKDLNQLVAYQTNLYAEAVSYDAQTSGGEPVHGITRRCRKDGSLVDVELSGVPVVGDGKPTGVIAIYHDITELKRTEDELQKAKAAAESANQAKSAFLAMMSHEIRTPMNAIIGMSGLLIDTPLDAEQRDFAETIRSSGDALLTIINDILDFSKIDAGKMQLEEQPFDLRECLESSMDLIRLRASEKGLELAYIMEPDVPPAIVGDVTRLRQILINLLNNAVKFTEQGEVVLTVSSEPVREAASLQATDGGKPGSYNLHFSVLDTGTGIPPDQLERLFQAFSQADASTSRRYGGTGLGLAISKRLSELMGGKMWVESEGVPGRGSTFHFSMVAQAATELKARSHLSGEQPQLRGKRLLIVDVNATNRRILTLQTKNWGMLPRDTAAPSEALAWLQRGDPFDLGILDLQMPGMDGPGLAAEIHKLRDVKSLPLVLSSSIGIRDAGIAPDLFTGFLLKPIRPSALFDTLITILAVGTAKPEETTPTTPQMDSEMASNHPLRILVAEDNVVNQKLALRLLSQMGYRADVAANGLEAIRSLERQPYDVILMDVQMPEMDGLEASRQICARWQRDVRPQIIAMTANAMQGDREMCLEAGMDDYISKPVRVNELVSALSKAAPIKK